MVVGDLNILCAVIPTKTNPILIVDANGMLAIPIAFERVQTVSRRTLQIIQ